MTRALKINLLHKETYEYIFFFYHHHAAKKATLPFFFSLLRLIFPNRFTANESFNYYGCADRTSEPIESVWDGVEGLKGVWANHLPHYHSAQGFLFLPGARGEIYFIYYFITFFFYRLLDVFLSQQALFPK